MKAVLLAAGLGTRLRSHTATPKCLMEVAGKAVIERTIEGLTRQGVGQFAVNLHYRPDDVQAFLGSGERFSAPMRYYHEPALLGTAGAVGQMRDWLDDDFLVVFADNVIRINLDCLVDRHRALRATTTVALSWRDEVHASGVAELTPEGRVSSFIEKPRPGETHSHWINAGILCCSPRVFDFIPDGVSDFGRDVLPALLRADEIVGGYQMSGDEGIYWIDTPEDLSNTEALLTQRRLLS